MTRYWWMPRYRDWSQRCLSVIHTQHTQFRGTETRWSTDRDGYGQCFFAEWGSAGGWILIEIAFSYSPRFDSWSRASTAGSLSVHNLTKSTFQKAKGERIKHSVRHLIRLLLGLQPFDRYLYKDYGRGPSIAMSFCHGTDLQFLDLRLAVRD